MSGGNREIPAKVGSVKKWSNRLARMGWLFFLLWASSLGTAEAPPGHAVPPAVWDVKRAGDSLPSWAGPVSTQRGVQMATWRIQIRPPGGDSKLAFTVVFREPADGFARVIWQGPGRAVTLCGNLFEKAASLHQRTLLIERSSLGGAGQLIVESTGEESVVERVELSWVEPLVLAAGWAAPSGLYLTPGGKVLPGDEMHGGGRHRPMDEDKGRVMDAVLDEGPIKIDGQSPVRFIAPIAGSPAYGRLEAQVAGLAPGEEPWLWVNGQALAAVAVELPGLDDPGFRQGALGQSLRYGGWRTVLAYVPVGLLRKGENQVDWQAAVGGGMTVRNVRLQVVFGEASQELAKAPAVSKPQAVISQVSLPVLEKGVEGFVEKRAQPKLRTGLSTGSGVVGLRQE